MHDQISNARKFRLFNAINDSHQKGLTIEIGFSLPAIRIIRALNQLLEYREQPSAIRSDSESEFFSHEFSRCTTE